MNELEKDQDPSAQRRMVQAQLCGRHSITLANGMQIHIWRRGNSYLVRGRLEGRQFGEVLGTDEVSAEARLCEIRTQLENGAFTLPRDRASQPKRARNLNMRAPLDDLIDVYIQDRRRLRGRKTANRYRSSGDHIKAYQSQPEIRKKYPSAAMVDRSYVVGLITYLHKRQVTRNGRPGAAPRLMSSKSVYEILTLLRTILEFGKRAEIGLLPPVFVNPVTGDLVAKPPRKSPIRDIKLNIERRIRMMRVADGFQLCVFAPLVVMPLRPDELCGMLVEEVDFNAGFAHFGSRFNDSDFTKGKTSFDVPFPEELTCPISHAMASRSSGPLFMKRALFERHVRNTTRIPQSESVEGIVAKRLLAVRPSTSQDAKLVSRTVLRELGGISYDELLTEFKKLATIAGIDGNVTPYDLRHAITTELSRVGVSENVRRYCTGHAMSDIMDTYTALDLPTIRKEFESYWEFVRELTEAISERCWHLFGSDLDNAA